jgi:hypothetical protein
MISVKRYNARTQKEWNALVTISANGTFLLDRRFMEYHKDRFIDHSLLLYQDNKLIALFPANEKGEKIFSHAGLTYGGLIMTPATKLFTTLSCIYSLVKYYHQKGFKHIIYKPVPWFFHTTPYFGDLYALFLLGSTLTAFNTGFITDLALPETVSKEGRYMIRKAGKYGVRVARARDCRTFWRDILVPHVTKRFGTKPVHTVEEIELLRNRFPKNILQYHAMIRDEIVAGVTIFLDRGVAHCQYIAGSDLARKTGANDYLIWHLMTRTFKNLRFFSFGTANMGSPDGRTLSRGLVAWKEGFGATMASYPCYDIETKNYRALAPYTYE